jgi:hypothetical protein
MKFAQNNHPTLLFGPTYFFIWHLRVINFFLLMLQTIKYLLYIFNCHTHCKVANGLFLLMGLTFESIQMLILTFNLLVCNQPYFDSDYVADIIIRTMLQTWRNSLNIGWDIFIWLAESSPLKQLQSEASLWLQHIWALFGNLLCKLAEQNSKRSPNAWQLKWSLWLKLL